MLPVHPADMDDGAKQASDERWRMFLATSWWPFISERITDPGLVTEVRLNPILICYLLL